MSRFAIAALSSAIILISNAPFAAAGDLGDGGYGERLGRHRPYMSGETYDPAYGRNDDADDEDDRNDDRYSRRDDGDDDDNDDDYAGTGVEEYDFHHYGSLKDDDDGGPRGHGVIVRPHREGCVQGWQVKRRLIGEGWRGFRLSTYGNGVAVIRAVRVHTGRPFILTVDGCTGETVSSVPVEPRRHFGQVGPRRFSWRN